MGLILEDVKTFSTYVYRTFDGTGNWDTKRRWVLKTLLRGQELNGKFQEQEYPYQNTLVTTEGKVKWTTNGETYAVGGAEYPSMQFTDLAVKAGYASMTAHPNSSNYTTFVGGKARSADLTAQPLSGDILVELCGVGTNGTSMDGGSGSVTVSTNQNWTPTQMGTVLYFNLTPFNTTTEIPMYTMSDFAFNALDDNARRLGTSAKRWVEVYATNGTINTSDERLKTDIQDLDDTLLDAWAEVPKKSYKWVDSSDGKTQVGVIAQDIVKAFAKYGIDVLDYGLINYDEEADRYGVNYAQASVLDAALALRESKILEERITKLEALLSQS
jgi:hypothetical protein